MDIDPFQDEQDEPDKRKENKKSYVKDLQTIIWGTKFKICTKANMHEIIDEQYAELNKRFENLNDNVGDSGWIINRWNYIFVDCLTIKPQRASSYIPTPEKYSNSRCGLTIKISQRVALSDEKSSTRVSHKS